MQHLLPRGFPDTNVGENITLCPQQNKKLPLLWVDVSMHVKAHFIGSFSMSLYVLNPPRNLKEDPSLAD